MLGFLERRFKFKLDNSRYNALSAPIPITLPHLGKPSIKERSKKLNFFLDLFFIEGFPKWGRVIGIGADNAL